MRAPGCRYKLQFPLHNYVVQRKGRTLTYLYSLLCLHLIEEVTKFGYISHGGMCAYIIVFAFSVSMYRLPMLAYISTFRILFDKSH